MESTLATSQNHSTQCICPELKLLYSSIVVKSQLSPNRYATQPKDEDILPGQEIITDRRSVTDEQIPGMPRAKLAGAEVMEDALESKHFGGGACVVGAHAVT